MEEIKKDELVAKENDVQDASIYDYNKLSEEDKKQVQTIMENIQDGDSNAVIQYGVGAQSEIANFSDKMLEDIKAKDTDYVGDILSNLMVKVKDTDVNGFVKDDPLENIPIIGKLVDKTKRFLAKYQKIENQIDEISEKLDNERMVLLKDIVMFDNLFEKNTECIHNLDLYIIAGKKKGNPMEKSKNSKNILIINDMPGYGKVALAAMLPILSNFGHSVYNLPTALVSNTLDYGKFTILDTTEYMKKSISVWKDLGFSFDCITTGFLASAF